MNLQVYKPLELAEALQHLNGFIFLDSNDAQFNHSVNATSCILAEPEEIVQGTIHEANDWSRLISCLNAYPAEARLAGWITYEGEFTFGVYLNYLIYHHATRLWREIGNLSSRMQMPVKQHVDWSEFKAQTPHETFLQQVQTIQQWIASGDIYQVNLAQQFSATVQGGHLFDLYQYLRTESPAPMSSYIRFENKEVLCASPETFLNIQNHNVETFPIKGTRARSPNAKIDQLALEELLSSTKENAELLMITDLLRNDLGQIADFGSVDVLEWKKAESFAQVHHLVSHIRAKIKPDLSSYDVLAACFPGGSITGAPKKRAMEIIQEVEKNKRGLYCGTIGWIQKNGTAQFNIVIRTLIRERELFSYHVGAGIVADSEPELEYQETLHKAVGLQLALAKWKKLHGTKP